MSYRPEAPAVRRNRGAILEVIGVELRDCASVLEIGSGTGQHAIFFASHLPWLTWQTSDLVENHEGICAWLEDARLDNVMSPLALDVENPPQFDDEYDAVFSANTAHIMSFAAVERMFRVVAQCLVKSGRFCLYGPFDLDDSLMTESNRDFDASLKRKDPAMGIRNLDELDKFAKDNGLHRTRSYAMPASNMIAVWTKNDVADEGTLYDHT